MASAALTSDKLLTQAELARELGVTRQSINELVSRGILTLTDKGRMLLSEAKAALEERMTQPNAKTLITIAKEREAEADNQLDAAEATQTSFHAARALRETYEAKLKRLKFEQESGVSIELTEAKRIVFTAFRTLRDQILNVPARIKDQCAAETDAVRVENLITAELTAALNSFEPDQALQDLDDDEPG